MNSTTRFLALIGTCVSLHALFSLVFLLEFRALDWILSIPWFLLNLAAQILCLLVFHQFDSLIGLQDDVNWLASAIGWPCLTTFFLIKGQEASWLFILFHPIMALGLLGLFVKTKCASFKAQKSPFDLTKASVTMASLCTLSLTASCYKSNDLTGLSACSAFILSNFALATNLTVFKDWSPLDFFLLGNIASNYLFTLAIIEKEVA